MGPSAEQRIIREEISQAIVRILLTLLALVSGGVIYYIDDLPLIFLLIVTGYLIFSFSWLFLVRKFSGDYPFRRRIIALNDLGAISICMYFANELGAIYFFAYLWVIVGNGMRFGSRALIESTLIGFSYFVIVVFNTQYWIDNIYITIGLLAGLVLLPAYYLILINRLSNVSDQLSAELARANYLATHDALSGLSNRAYYFQRLEDKINEAKRYNEIFIVMYLDLDVFKKINDDWGHNYGDIIIKEIADRIQRYVRKSDTVARLGGDEFALILHSINDAFVLSSFSQRLINVIAQPVIIEGNELQVTASIGISQFPADGESTEELINGADQSMYASKKRGRNRFTLSSNMPRIV
jgi:diguanylate cyclase (GGDEF)-like protein